MGGRGAPTPSARPAGVPTSTTTVSPTPPASRSTSAGTGPAGRGRPGPVGRADRGRLPQPARLRAGMPWDDVAVLRAYRRYRSQVGPTFTTGYVDEVLVQHAVVARTWSSCSRPGSSVRAAGTSIARAAHRCRRCDPVQRLDHDRILRGFWHWSTPPCAPTVPDDAPDGGPVSPSSSTPRRCPTCPGRCRTGDLRPRPDGRRGPPPRGPVARGGIRWSDRPDDFRSEVLDLMRTQVLKNALIVPTGAKGGFVLRRTAGSTTGRPTRSSCPACSRSPTTWW